MHLHSTQMRLSKQICEKQNIRVCVMMNCCFALYTKKHQRRNGQIPSITYKHNNLNIQGTLRHLTKTNDKKHDDILVKLCLFVLSLGNDALNDKVIADFPLKCRNSDLDDNVNKDIFWFLTTILISRNMLVCQSLVCSRCYECVADCFWFHGAFKFFQML